MASLRQLLGPSLAKRSESVHSLSWEGAAAAHQPLPPSSVSDQKPDLHPDLAMAAVYGLQATEAAGFQSVHQTHERLDMGWAVGLRASIRDTLARDTCAGAVQKQLRIAEDRTV